jgi:putative flippase GtrA
VAPEAALRMLHVVFNRELAKFLAVGAISAAADFTVLYVVSRFAGPATAFLAAYPVGAAVHFSLNKFWTFGCLRRDYARQIFQYGATVFATFLVQSVVYAVVVRLSEGNVLLAKACAIPPSTLVCYVLLKFGVFTRRVAASE